MQYFTIKDILISPFAFFWVKSGYNGAFCATQEHPTSVRIMADIPIRHTAPAGDGVRSGVDEGVVVAVGPVTSDPSFRTGLRVGGGSRMGIHPWPTQ